MCGHNAQCHVWWNLKSTSAPHSKSHTCWWRADDIGLVATGPGHLTVIESTMNSSVYQSILESNVRTSVQQLKLSQYWVMQQDNDPKHTKSTIERLERKESRGCNSKSKSRAHPDWNAVTRAVRKQMPTNINKLHQCCKEEAIPPERCKRLIKSYRKWLLPSNFC